MSIRPRAAHLTQWPDLPFTEWKDTADTLHMWTQIVGKIRLTYSPWTNHSWHVTLYPTARGLTTSPIPFGARAFEIGFDFVDHLLVVETNDGERARLELRPRTVADFYRELLQAMRAMNLEVSINTTPNEVVNPIRFDEDNEHRTYDPDLANRFWRILLQTDRVMKIFRSRFIGKCSPVHFFWGSFDLAVTRFSGRPAPPHPGGVPNLPDWVAREAYSHEVSSCGFWSGGEPTPFPLFYSYAYPEPPGFKGAVLPSGEYNTALKEFVLSYDSVRNAKAPDMVLLNFLEATYTAAAELGRWDRGALERRG